MGPSAPATTRPTPVPPSTPHPGTPAPNTPAPQPSRTPTGLPGGGTGSSPAPGCARTVPQLAFLRGSCEDDLCVDVMRDRMDRSNEGAADIALTARHADDGTTLVSLDAG
ncbi:hypothetical protein [Streptomyces sp. A0592]|uniref:hypothetical protein n=1 Tax=Streptomyces sp. A0592 TaxID=2563099 RepID=UPI00109E3C03|nr:hypothetical protein [Streptomyces sp. A0592]THA86278.1 hypothetical protein E6U81_04650 [Streptomyces sp. A0592]